MNIFARIAAFASVALGANATGSPASHPFLLFTEADKPALLAKAARPGSRSAEALERLRNGPAAFESDEWREILLEAAVKYALTGDDRAGAGAQATLDAVFRAVRPESLVMSHRGPYPRLHREGEFAWPVALAYDLLHHRMSVEQRRVAVSWLGEMVEWYWRELDNGGKIQLHNFWTGAWGSMGLAALAIRHDSERADLAVKLERCADRAYWLLNDGIPPDQWHLDPRNAKNYHLFVARSGLYVEGHGYANYGLDQNVLFAYAWQRATGRTMIVPAESIAATTLYYAYGLQADRHMLNLGDNTWKPWGSANPTTSRMGGHHLIFAKLAGDPVLRFAWDYVNTATKRDFWTVVFYPENIASVSPDAAGLPAGRYFQDKNAGDGGLVTMKSGWTGTDAVSAWLLNRHDWANHAHFDPNSFGLAAYGDRFIDDQNHSPYNRANHALSVEQNTLLIDDQPLGRLGSWGSSSLGRIVGFTSGDGGTIARGEAAFPYNNSGKDARPADQKAFVRGDRIFGLVMGGEAPPFVISIDDVEKDGAEHVYEWRAHAALGIGADRIRGLGTVRAPFVMEGKHAKLHVMFVQPEPFQGKVDDYQPSFGELNQHHPILRARQAAVVRSHFFGVFYPQKNGAEMPSATALGIPGGIAAKLAWSGGREDILLERRERDGVSALGLETDGRFAVVRTTAAQLKSAMLLEGTTLKYHGKRIVQIDGAMSASVSLSQSGRIASVDGVGITSLALYAPSATVLRVNGRATAFTRDGDYVLTGADVLAKSSKANAGR